MSDKKFNEVVIETRSCYIDAERGFKACCSACGTFQEVSAQEFKYPFAVGAEQLGYVAKMRAWNCCHEGKEPLDGFPDPPDEEYTLLAK